MQNDFSQSAAQRPKALKPLGGAPRFTEHPGLGQECGFFDKSLGWLWGTLKVEIDL